MKRSSFLKLCLAFGSFVSAPFVGFSKAKSNSRVAKGFKVDAGKDRFDKSISLFEGDTFYSKIATQDTDGDMYLFESTRINNGGPTLHFHYDQDEWWYVLQGEFIFKIGDDMFTAKAGDSFLGPRKVPHTFAKTGEGEAKLLILFQPAGKMEEYFKAASEGVLKNMSEQEKDNFRKAYGFEKAGPAINHEKST